MSKKIFISIVLLSFSFAGFFLYSSFNASQKIQDPLSSFLETSINKADVITETISPFSGDMSPYSSCMTSAPKSSNKGEIYALVNTNKVLQMFQEKQTNPQFKEDIKSELNAVLGYAFRNFQINWIWKENIREALQFSENDTQYIFYVTPSEESFWYCYMTHGPEFLKNFFYSETVTYEAHDENFSSDINLPFINKTIDGFAPWGSNIILRTENGQQCETWAKDDNSFICYFSQDFVAKEKITANITTPDGTPYYIEKREGDEHGSAKSLEFILDEGTLDEYKLK